MCRTGGRRCPAYSDPEKIAARNARRRAAYKSKKYSSSVANKNNISENTNLINKNTDENKITSEINHSYDSVLSKPVFGEEKSTFVVDPKIDKSVRFKPDELFTVGSETIFNKNLNVEVRENSGILSEIGYFNNKTVSGTLDYTKLDGSSKVEEELGFRRIEKDKRYDLTKYNLIEPSDFINLSKVEGEVYGLTYDERKSIENFSDYSYEYLNDALFNKEVALDDKVEKKSFDEISDDLEYNKDKRTFNNVSTVVDTLDSALAKGPKRQRTVYRGVRSSSPIFEKDNKLMKVSEWVSENYKVGSEIKFDGYQSSTPKPEAMSAFLTDNGLMYEIITPEGLNISSESSFDTEFEITLPRNARYTVVSVNEGVDVRIHEKRECANVTLVRLMAINDKGEILDGTNSDPIKPMIKEEYKEVEAKDSDW